MFSVRADFNERNTQRGSSLPGGAGGSCGHRAVAAPPSAISRCSGGTLPLFPSWAHQAATARLTRIGFLLGEGCPELAAAFREGLSRLGYAERRNIIIEARSS